MSRSSYKLTKLIGNIIHSIDGIETPIPRVGVVPYLVIDEEEPGREEGLTLIDTCYISELPKIENYLKNLNPSYDLTQIKRIILTHLHNDHVQAANEIKRRSGGAKIYAHWAEARYLANPQTYQGPPKEDIFTSYWSQFFPFGNYARFKPYEREPIKVDKEVTDGETIRGGIPLEVIHAPGHTPGNIALYLKEYKTVIGGDCLFKSVFGMPGLFSPLRFNSIDPVEAAISAQRIAENFDFDKLLLAHQDSPILQGAQEAVSKAASRAFEFYSEIGAFQPRSG